LRISSTSDGHSEFQSDTLAWIREQHPGLPVMGGNVITADAFTFLARSGAAAVKVGMGSGSICITQEQKGTGRGLATALMDVVSGRDAWHVVTGCYLPIIADGGKET
jgi:IMP dehydrogenase